MNPRKQWSSITSCVATHKCNIIETHSTVVCYDACTNSYTCLGAGEAFTQLHRVINSNNNHTHVCVHISDFPYNGKDTGYH